MRKTAEHLLSEIAQLQTRLDEAANLLQTVGPGLRDMLLQTFSEDSGPAALDPRSAGTPVSHPPLGQGPAPRQAGDGTPRTNQTALSIEQRYWRLIEKAEEGIWILDDRDLTAFANRKMADMLGRDVSEMIGQPILAFLDGPDRDRLRQALQRRRQGRRESYDMRFVRKDGRDLWAIVSTSPIVDESGRYSGSLKMITDITERRRLERQAAEIARREQQRIGRDLHDVLGQTLAALAFLCKTLRQKLQAAGRPEMVEVDQIAALVQDSMKQVRSLAKGLQTVPIHPDGLRKALAEYVSDVEALYGIACGFECPEAVPLADPATGSHLFRIAQEAVTDAIHHARATQVTIRLGRGKAGRLNLEIVSNGMAAPGALSRNELGLRMMNQRAGTIGASLRIRKGPAGGTVVTCSVFGGGAEAEVQSGHDNATGSGHKQ